MVYLQFITLLTVGLLGLCMVLTTLLDWSSAGSGGAPDRRAGRFTLS
ncbi:MAG: hypothetical protein HY554_03010 [Elusimicrobia bacterium]|nr:hypothetical protein [Elusimicrobiota bacterium]